MRVFLCLLCFAMSSLAVSANASAEISDGEIRIGFITDFRGIYSDLAGQGSLTAAEMAVEDAGSSAAGHPVRVIVGGDAQLDPARGVQLARELHEEHQVDVITGQVGSDVALAVQAYATEHDIAIFHSGPASNDLTGTECSPVGIQWAFNNYSLAAGTVASTFSEENDRWFFITADYNWGHDIFDYGKALVEEAGGQVVGNALSPYQAATFAGEIEQAIASDATVISLAQAGGDLQRTIREGFELGLNQSGMAVVAMDMYITDVRALGLYVTGGYTFPTSFYWDIDDARREWAERFRKREGVMPTMPHAGIYSAVSHYLRAVDEIGDDSGRAAVAQMREMPIDDFFVRDGYIREDGQMMHDMFLMRVKEPLESKRAWDYLELVKKIPADEAFGPLELTECPLVKG